MKLNQVDGGLENDVRTSSAFVLVATANAHPPFPAQRLLLLLSAIIRPFFSSLTPTDQAAIISPPTSAHIHCQRAEQTPAVIRK